MTQTDVKETAPGDATPIPAQVLLILYTLHAMNA
jgi:hypothetical protein